MVVVIDEEIDSEEGVDINKYRKSVRKQIH